MTSYGYAGVLLIRLNEMDGHCSSCCQRSKRDAQEAEQVGAGGSCDQGREIPCQLCLTREQGIFSTYVPLVSLVLCLCRPIVS